MNYKTLSLTIISIVSLLTACEANDGTAKTDLDLQSKGVTQLDPQSKERVASAYSLNDGHYFAEELDYSVDGWKNIVNFDVINGEINNITFDAVNEEATAFKRNLSLKGEYTLNTKDSPTLEWHEQLELIEKTIIKHLPFDELTVDSDLLKLSEITIDINPFISLLNTAIATGPMEVGRYQDGHYYAQTSIENSDSLHIINLIVQNGYIIAVNWDTILSDKETKLASETIVGQELTEQWKEQSTLLEQYLLEIQDPMQMTFNENDKTNDVNGVTIDVHQFIELATKALANGPSLN